MYIKYIQLLLLSLSPLVEPRYVIIYALLQNIDIKIAILIAISGTLLLATILTFIIDTLDRFLRSLKNSKYRILVRIYNLYLKYVENSRIRVKNYVDKYGFIGLIIFIAIPLPFTGMWSGAVAGYVIGLDRYRIFTSLLVGGLLSIMFTLVLTLFGVNILNVIY